MSQALPEQISSDRDKDASVVFTCIGDTETSLKIIPVAKAIARALDATVTLVHAIDQSEAAHVPFDPVEWEIVRRGAREYAKDIADRFGNANQTIEARVLEGKRDEQFCSCGSAPSDITAICDEDGSPGQRLGACTRRLLENSSGSVLLVPRTFPDTNEVHFSRILVPLDGSAQAEAALPYAVQIAAAENAELVLVHATPEPTLTRVGPLSKSDNELVQKIRDRNERVAKDYLGRIKARIGPDFTDVIPLVLSDGDVRRQLTDGTMLSAKDLVILTSHGQSAHADVPHGDVASFMLERTKAPILMIRHGAATEKAHAHYRTRSKGARRPGGTPK